MPDLAPLKTWLAAVTTDKVVMRTEDLRLLVQTADQSPLPSGPALVGGQRS